jgi:hypothetical protein
MPVVTDYTALLSGNYWNGIEVTGEPVIVTFSFPTTAPAYDSSVPGFTAATAGTFTPFTAAEQAQAIQALSEWASASGLVFIEVARARATSTSRTSISARRAIAATAASASIPLATGTITAIRISRAI